MRDGQSNGLTLISTFAGGGGSSCGYKAAGYDVRLAVEWDEGAAACYRLNFPSTTMYEGDIAELSGDGALSLAELKRGELDVLDGSPPCQGFSTAGARRYSDPRNSLFREYVRLLGALKPRAFVMENVSGLAKGKMRLAFAEITRALRGEGYRVSCRLLNAWHYGVPQDRRRLIWVGMRDDLGIEPSHPEPTTRRPVTVGEAIGQDAITRGWRGSIARGEYRDVSAALLASSPPKVATRERHSSKVLESWVERRPGQYVGGDHYTFKLDSKAPCPTQMRKLMFHPDEPRYITVEEAKILQGFPPWFRVDDYRIVGNSVPPPMAEAVGRHVAALLEGTK